MTTRKSTEAERFNETKELLRIANARAKAAERAVERLVRLVLGGDPEKDYPAGTTRPFVALVEASSSSADEVRAWAYGKTRYFR